MIDLKRFPCKECLYYAPENNTCQSKKAATGGIGVVGMFEKLYCEPYGRREDEREEDVRP